jgi:hypothetical protein
MGDALLTLPLLAELISLPWVTGVQFVGLPVVRPIVERFLPEVSFVDGGRLARKAAGSYLASHRAASELLEESVLPFAPEIVLAPRSDHNDVAVYELVARSRARLTVGYVGPVPGPLTRHEALASAAVARWVFDVALRPDRHRHEASVALAVAEPIGVRAAEEPTFELAGGRAGSISAPTSGGLHVVVAPVAGKPKRDWPLERYAQVLAQVAASGPVRITVAGGAERTTSAERLGALTGLEVGAVPEPADLLGTLDVMSAADVFLGADSGPAHLAGLAGLPGVVVSCHPRTGSLSHSNAPTRFRPLNGRSTVVQPATATPPCTTGCEADEPHCILGIDAEEVRAALAARIEELEVAG